MSGEHLDGDKDARLRFQENRRIVLIGHTGLKNFFAFSSDASSDGAGA